MANTITDRAIKLIELSSLDELARMSDTNYSRWANIKRRTARVGAEEVETLAKAFPNYSWWLLRGEVMPEIGQTSPEYDEANSNLTNQSAG